MRPVLRLVPLLLAVACARGDKPPADTPAATRAAGVSSGDIAGSWVMTTRREGSDSVILNFVFNATDSDTGWVFNFPGRDPVPVRVVAIEGDSIITETGPYESALRKGVQVSTRSVMRIRNGRLTGSTAATYSTGEVVRLTAEGFRP